MFKKMFAAFIMLFLATAAYAQDEDTTTTETTTNPPTVIENYNDSTVDSTSESTTTVISPPPSAISPSINNTNSDLCTVGVSGAVQTQILGISAGSTVRDMNCEKLKNASLLYNMGMKVAAVSVMCQDPRIFTAMMNAGTPCPIDGMIGEQAKDAWNNPENESIRPDAQSTGGLNLDPETRTTVFGGAIGLGLLAVLLGG